MASFLWQASAHYAPELRHELMATYLDAARLYTDVDEGRFRERMRLFVLFRTLQALGAYGFRGYFERKKHFLDSIAPAIRNLREWLSEGECPYPYLYDVLSRMVELPAFRTEVSARPDEPCGKDTGMERAADVLRADIGPASVSLYDGRGPLVVRVFSFSYKKGIPEDTSGNGGGYVFDCRSTHNPGRYEPYKALTGLDEPVIRFLEEDGEILTFLDSVYKLADAHVALYRPDVCFRMYGRPSPQRLFCPTSGRASACEVRHRSTDMSSRAKYRTDIASDGAIAQRTSFSCLYTFIKSFKASLMLG